MIASEKKRYALHKLLIMISCCAVVVLLARPQNENIRNISIMIALGVAVLLLIPGKYCVIPSVRESLSRSAWIQAVLICVFSIAFFLTFRERWFSVARPRPGTSFVGKWWPAVFSAVSVFFVLAAVPLEWKLCAAGRDLYERLQAASDPGEDRLGRVPMRTVKYILVAVLILLHFHIMQFSMSPFWLPFNNMPWAFFFLNLTVYTGVSFVLVLILQRWRLAMLVSSIFFSVWGIANHYVYLFHGSPLYPAELVNAKTAFDVLGEYRILFTEIPWAVIALVILTFYVLRLLWAADRERPVFRWRVIAARAFLAALFVFLAYRMLIANSAGLVRANPSARSSRFGFICAAVVDTKETLHPLIVPEGYSPEKLPEPEVTAGSSAQDCPDIILILNETFCDLGYYANVTADRDPFAPFYQIDGAAYGHAVTPMSGGGTNNSEYELLTGFPYYLVTAYAPFNYLDFGKIDCNVVQYLKQLGYITEGIHPKSRANYNRPTAYPALGFDRVILGPPEGFDRGRYGNRQHLDSNYYSLLESEYEAMADVDAPRFLYLLTYQNHGGYSQNKPEYDTVHVAGNYGDQAEIINEYLTSVSMSVDAFIELTEYYSGVDRPVVICMVGDHAPSFINSLESEEFKDDEKDLAKRVVPYVLWNNYGADLSGCAEYINVFGLMPQLVHLTAMPDTPFYRAVRTMEENYPVLIKSGLTMDKAGKLSQYNADDPAYDPITEYLYMSYNGLNHSEDYAAEYFFPSAGG